MKGYRIFIIIFLLLLALYIVAELNRPKPVSWRVTLSKGDKNPFGGYILYNRLKDVFPEASVGSYRMPVYNQLNNSYDENTAYLLCSDELKLSGNDIEELLNYVYDGNYLLLSASMPAKVLMDSLGLKTDVFFPSLTDSVSINFVDPALKAPEDFTFRKMTLNNYFSTIDSSNTKVLGTNHRSQANFVEIHYGMGKIFAHANPLVFSNYFLLKNNNAEYTARVLSHLPNDVAYLYWDEYYKLGPDRAGSPLRFFLSDQYLVWALRLSVIGMLLYVFFEMKRRQRIIPVIAPLRNTTLAFIQTIATVYLQQKDNKSVALKKITYLLEFVRNKYFIATHVLDNDFVEHLSRKSGVDKASVQQLVQAIENIHHTQQVNDHYLLEVNNLIDNFYKQVQ